MYVKYTDLNEFGVYILVHCLDTKLQQNPMNKAAD
jgi:hypothetical protein